MELGYKRIFWGFFFATFHLNIGPIQVFPDIIGWFIVAFGIAILNSNYECNEWEKALFFNKIIIVVLLIAHLLTWAGITALTIFPFSQILTGILILLISYYILEGARLYYESRELEWLAGYCTLRQKAVILLAFEYLMLSCINSILNNKIIYYLVIIVYMLLIIWFMKMMSVLKRCN